MCVFSQLIRVWFICRVVPTESLKRMKNRRGIFFIFYFYNIIFHRRFQICRRSVRRDSRMQISAAIFHSIRANFTFKREKRSRSRGKIARKNKSDFILKCVRFERFAFGRNAIFIQRRNYYSWFSRYFHIIKLSYLLSYWASLV